jgi:hypothetical protein
MQGAKIIVCLANHGLNYTSLSIASRVGGIAARLST